jgi:hypothetical protein
VENKVDKARIQASMARLQDILQGIGETANQVSTWRCPYKNAQDLCTAAFGCRNQSRPPDGDKLPVCLGSDDLDYRIAWDTQPTSE